MAILGAVAGEWVRMGMRLENEGEEGGLGLRRRIKSKWFLK